MDEKKVLAHYGYEERPAKLMGFWETETFPKNLAALPEALGFLMGANKFRIVIDYDPEYERSIVQVIPQEKHFYSIETTEKEIKIIPPEGQTAISLPREEIEHFISDIKGISREENKSVLYRFSEDALNAL